VISPFIRGDEAALDEPGFWDRNQPGFRFSTSAPGTRAFFDEVERHRYALEPHIPQLVEFDRWTAKEVLEAGCGIGTDGVRFARAGAFYTGVDASPAAVELAQRRFELEQLPARFVNAPVTALPFANESFDLVFSHGVVHHVADTDRAVREFHRVLRPGGTAIVMVYHRHSFNYFVNIMIVRRMLAAFLLVPRAPEAIARATGEHAEVLQGHRELLRRYGLRYLTDSQMFFTNNTDGPGNPLTKAFTREDVKELFRDFADVRTATRFLNLRLYPRGDRLAATRVARRLEKVVGWHLYVFARKPSMA
jgi:SAM-dependent methyltransferase